MEYLKLSRDISDMLVSHRRTVHGYAETGFDIPKTLGYIEAVLKENGLHARECGGGLIADIEGKSNDKIILRADCDALPTEEKSTLPFSSANGCAHLCGHDMHTAMLLGAASMIKRHSNRLRRGIRLVFQPAEEILCGAKRMLACGAADGISAAYGMHVLPAMPFECGTVILPPEGIAAPYAEFFRITVRGRASHGASPHRGRDALLCGANMIGALESLIARESDPMTPSALTVGKMHAGTAANAIADEAVLEGTLRSLDTSHAKYLSRRAREITENTARANDCTAVFEALSACPALDNSAVLLKSAEEVLKKALPRVLTAKEARTEKSIGGSEDFAYFSEKLPSLFFSLCAGSEDFCPHPLHHPEVRFDEGCLSYGCAALCALAFDENGGKD